MSIDINLFGQGGTCMLHRFGDTRQARNWLQKMCVVFESTDARTDESIMHGAWFGGLNLTHPIFHAAGMSDMCLRLMKAIHATFSTAEEACKAYSTVMKFWTWEGETHVWCPDNFFVSQMKRRQVNPAIFRSHIQRGGACVLRGGACVLRPSSYLIMIA